MRDVKLERPLGQEIPLTFHKRNVDDRTCINQIRVPNVIKRGDHVHGRLSEAPIALSDDGQTFARHNQVPNNTDGLGFHISLPRGY